jgi:hypothetical protein
MTLTPKSVPQCSSVPPKYASGLVLSLLALGRESHLLSPAGGRIGLDYRTSVSPQETCGHVVGLPRCAGQARKVPDPNSVLMQHPQAACRGSVRNGTVARQSERIRRPREVVRP